MSDLQLHKKRFFDGVWEGLITGVEGDEAPRVSVTHEAENIEGVSLSAEGDAGWLLKVSVPSYAISDGLHSFLITDEATGDRLGSFEILAGEALGEDIRAEVNLLRAELDMLKRAFRRHCVETM